MRSAKPSGSCGAISDRSDRRIPSNQCEGAGQPPCARARSDVATGDSPAWLHGWLLLLPAGAAGAVHALPGGRDAVAQLLLDPEAGARPAVCVGRGQLRAMVDDPMFWQALGNNVWFALGTIPAVDRAGAADGDLGERAHRRAARSLRLAFFTPTVLPMIAVANIWLFFYTPDYGLLEQITGALRSAEPQLARAAGRPRSAA